MTDLVKNTKGLREMMFGELSALRRGEALPSRTNAISRAAAQIIATSKLELDQAKLKYLVGKGGGDTVISPVDM